MLQLGEERGGGRGGSSTPSRRPASPLPPFTSQLSSGHVQYRGQLLTFELSESAHRRPRSLLLEETRRPSLPNLPPPPVLPVALSLWCCALTLLVSAVGFSSWF